MVWILIISELILNLSSSFEASIASHTKWPVAIIVTSVPSDNKTAFPISKFWFMSVKFGTFGLPNLR